MAEGLANWAFRKRKTAFHFLAGGGAYFKINMDRIQNEDVNEHNHLI